MKKPVLILFFFITWIAIGLCLYITLVKNPFLPERGDSGSRISGDQRLNSNTDFVEAAKLVTPAVVHIKSTYGASDADTDGGGGASQAFGSGVLIDKNGYIATNNHVVENAVRIDVVLPDRREFEAKLIGRDPNTDLALLKINANDLPILKFGNSDVVKVGEWVLAVGYPYSLNTTATAGIISAKGRNIGIINHSSPDQESQQATHAIESFLQTDAAINPGNSGGALVNLNGELIGINAAIASFTGSFSGYAFAIPVNLAKKILDDFRKFGVVKRAVLGVNFPSPNVEDQYLKAQGIVPGSIKGVLITDIQTGSAAASAGLKAGDIIQRLDSTQIFSSTEFSERMARHRPGDKISLTYSRAGKSNTTSLVLKGEVESPNQASDELAIQNLYKKIGAKFATLPPQLKQRLNLNFGVIVSEVYKDGIFDQLKVPKGTIIAYINGRKMSSPHDVETTLIEAQKNTIQVLAITPDGAKVTFTFSFGV